MEAVFKSIDLVVSKTYHPSGIITVMIVFQHCIYVSVLEGGHENPLLDSRFPDISGKGRGYQLQAYSDGVDGWSTLRKVSVWQTIGALEQEFKDRISRLAQAKAETSSTSSAAEKGRPLGDAEPKGSDSDASILPQSLDISLDNESLDSKHLHSEPISQQIQIVSDLKAMSVQDDDEAKQSAPDSVEIVAVAESKVDASVDLIDEFEASSSSSSEAKTTELKSLSPLGPRGPLSIAVARPHHLPKMESLSSKLDDIRRNMVMSGESEMPWDATGRPTGKKKGKKAKKLSAANDSSTTNVGMDSDDISSSEFLRNEIGKLDAGIISGDDRDRTGESK